MESVKMPKKCYVFSLVALCACIFLFFLKERQKTNATAANPLRIVGTRTQEEGKIAVKCLDGSRSQQKMVDTDGRATVECMKEEGEADDDSSQNLDATECFCDLIDEWRKFRGKGVTVEDVNRFKQIFQRVPTSRKDECVHRALNLIPDSNVMLLVGILMDKSQDTATIETVFADILNRSEETKQPILAEVAKDPSHPCWSDARWILEVTGKADSMSVIKK